MNTKYILLFGKAFLIILAMSKNYANGFKRDRKNPGKMIIESGCPYDNDDQLLKLLNLGYIF